MAALDPAVAAVRSAVRRGVRGLGYPTDPAPLALVACSGGPDSTALAAAARFTLPRLGWRVGLVTVDHQLQEGSAERAKRVADWATAAGFEPVRVETVTVHAPTDGSAGPKSGRTGGPEAAARDARYEALAAAARASGAAAVLLGHTRDDQAETVLLAVVRGAGPRGLAGMPVRSQYPRAPRRIRPPGDGIESGPASDLGTPTEFLRPLLAVSRAQSRAACTAENLPVWDDPHNTDPAFRRTHARALLALLAEHLGPAVVDNLARTARLAAADTAALDALARRAARRAHVPGGGLSADRLARLPDAVRTRVLHRWAALLGVPGSALSHRHVAALDALVTDWHGQGSVSLPRGLTVVRRDGVLWPGGDAAGLTA
jgi:tRNA(Ile)-lysidine synthase